MHCELPLDKRNINNTNATAVTNIKKRGRKIHTIIPNNILGYYYNLTHIDIVLSITKAVVATTARFIGFTT